MREFPPSYAPTTYSLEHFQANLRHGFTNYDYLLREKYEEVDERGTGGLGLQILCLKYIFQHDGTCTYDGGEEPWADCPTLFEIYNALKWTATDKAWEAYQRWLEQQES